MALRWSERLTDLRAAARVVKDTQHCFINALKKSLWVLRKLRFAYVS